MALLPTGILEKKKHMEPRSAYAAEAERLKRDYIEARVLSATPVEVVAMLFEVAIAGLLEAIAHLKAGERQARSRAITRAEQAVQELIFALNHSVDPRFSRRAEGLYRYALARMVAGHARESEREFREALAVLTPLEKAWGVLKVRITEGPKESAPEAPEAAREDRPAVNPYSAYQQEPVTPGRDWSC